MVRAVLLLIGLAISGLGRTQGLADRLREIDLNDYAAGVALSTRSLPYRGAGASVVAYPYLTSVEDPTLTDAPVVIRGGEFGWRRVTDEGLELGVLAHVETLGYGTDPDPELRLLDPPSWTLELGPTIGWRRGAIQPDLTVRKGMLGGHSGWVGQLSLSVPRDLDRGFLVPYVAVVAQDAGFVSHYYGVRPRDGAAPGLAFQPADALNYRVGLRAGFRLSDLWVLTGSLRVDWLDDVVSDSPVVDDDRLLGMTLGLAYNRSVFREANPGAFDPLPETRFALTAIAVDASVESELALPGPATSQTTTLDADDALGLPDDSTLHRADLSLRLAMAHRVEIGYMELSRSRTRVLERPIEIGGTRFEAGERVTGRSQSRFPRIAYGYSLLRDPQKELGVLLGLHWPSLETSIVGESGEVRAERARSPFFTFGAFGEVGLRGAFSARARVELGGLDFDRYEGWILDGQLAAAWEPTPWLAVLLGYAVHSIRLDGLEEQFAGTARQTFSGPFAGFSLSF